MSWVELNVDLGELPDEPAELFSLATMANVACGGHAGDAASMTAALSLAAAHGTKVAAHPSYPDRAGFGRTSMILPPRDLGRAVEDQCAALQQLARRMRRPISAVKPHGALYHDAAHDPFLASEVLDGTERGLGLRGALLLVIGPPCGALFDEAHRRGIRYAREGFADRAYGADGSLVPRTRPGALILDPKACATQAMTLVRGGSLETICVHGDTKAAVAIARAVRAALLEAGVLPVSA